MTHRGQSKNRPVVARGSRAIRTRAGTGTIDRTRARAADEVVLAKALRALITRGQGHIQPLDGG